MKVIQYSITLKYLYVGIDCWFPLIASYVILLFLLLLSNEEEIEEISVQLELTGFSL